MIKINLASRKRSAISPQRAAGEMPKITFDTQTLHNIVSELQGLPLQKFAICGVIALIATFLLSSYKDDQVRVQAEELEKLSAEKPKLQAEAGKIKNLEDLQKRMGADEKVIRDKLTTIQKLAADRTSTVQVLEEVARITPPEVWLSSLDLKNGALLLKGRSEDVTKVTDFIHSFRSSSLFSETNPGDLNKSEDEQKKELISFSISAKKRQSP